MNKSFFYIIVPAVLIFMFSCRVTKQAVNSQDNVYFIPTLHRIHQKNQFYNYDTLLSIVQRIHPDVIAVEVRQVDMDEDTSFLAKNYPHEFVMMKKYFPDKKIVGFDWWGEDIENTKTADLPKDYFENMPRTRQQKLLDKDSITSNKLKVCWQYQKERFSLIKDMSLSQILSSRDGELVQLFYDSLRKQLTGTPYYDGLVKTSDDRNQKILENILQIIKENKHKRIVILTGDDHFQLLKDKFPNKQP